AHRLRDEERVVGRAREDRHLLGRQRGRQVDLLAAEAEAEQPEAAHGGIALHPGQRQGGARDERRGGVDLAGEPGVVQADRVGLLELDAADRVAHGEAEHHAARDEDGQEQRAAQHLVTRAPQPGAHDDAAPCEPVAAGSAPPKRSSHAASWSSPSFWNSRPGGRTSPPGRSAARSSSSPSRRSDGQSTPGNASRSVAAAPGTKGSDATAHATTNPSAVRSVHAVRSRSTLTVFHGSRDWRYSLPSAHSARSDVADLRNSRSCRLRRYSSSRAPARDASAASSAPGSPPSGTRSSKWRDTRVTVRFTRFPNVPTRSLFTALPNSSQVKLASSDSGALAIRYQRQ